MHISNTLISIYDESLIIQRGLDAGKQIRP